uniref:Uncharacterized protein n=1 Tax=Anguilla anguilla TaxID=7936 RepID=A0A0E9RAJ5_ANGAN
MENSMYVLLTQCEYVPLTLHCIYVNGSVNIPLLHVDLVFFFYPTLTLYCRNVSIHNINVCIK